MVWFSTQQRSKSTHGNLQFSWVLNCLACVILSEPMLHVWTNTSQILDRLEGEERAIPKLSFYRYRTTVNFRSTLKTPFT